jgi:hypothetical protein
MNPVEDAAPAMSPKASPAKASKAKVAAKPPLPSGKPPQAVAPASTALEPVADPQASASTPAPPPEPAPEPVPAPPAEDETAPVIDVSFPLKVPALTDEELANVKMEPLSPRKQRPSVGGKSLNLNLSVLYSHHLVISAGSSSTPTASPIKRTVSACISKSAVCFDVLCFLS